MSDESHKVLSRKVAVQRKPDGEPLGVALWIGSEIIEKSFARSGERFVLSFSCKEIVLEKSATGKKGSDLRLQKFEDKTLGMAIWIPGWLLRKSNCSLDNELNFKLDVKGRTVYIAPA